MKMMISTSSSLLLLLLLGLSQANPIKKEGNDPKKPPSASKILTANNGTTEFLLQGDLIAPKNRNSMKCFQGDSCKWKKSSNGQVVIGYTISSEYSSSQKQVIETALKSFASMSCIRFVPRTTESDYINVVSQNGCYSNLGRQGGPQVLSIHKNNCMTNKIIQHEALHALGFEHEHIRSDRDQYVKINFANISPNQAHNFAKADTNNLGTPFDYNSVMLYPRRGFAVDPNVDVIIPIPNSNTPIGMATTLSRIDIQRLNLLYKC